MEASDLQGLIEIMGGKKGLGLSRAIGTPLELNAVVERGLPMSAFRATAGFLSESLTREAVDISKRTFDRRKKKGQRLPRSESERLVNFARVISTARRVFGDDERARRWLITESRALGARPIDLVRSFIGLEAVLDDLGRIEHGIFA